MRRISPEAGDFFAKNLDKQTKAEKPHDPETAPPQQESEAARRAEEALDSIDLEPDQAKEEIKDIVEAVKDEAKDADETVAEAAQDMQTDPKRKKSFLQKLSSGKKKIVAAVGLSLFLTTMAPNVSAGSRYQEKGKRPTRTEQSFSPFSWLGEKIAPEMNRVHRAEREIMYGTPQRNPNGSIKERRGEIVRENNGLRHELSRYMNGSWRKRTVNGIPFKQFEISDRVELFDDWSIQERTVDTPAGTFDYYGPWPDKPCPPSVFIMYTSGNLDTFTIGKFPGPTTRAWRPGSTIEPSKMTNRFYRVQKLHPRRSTGYTPSQNSMIDIESQNFWIMWEMYRQDPNQRSFMNRSEVARNIEKYRDASWQEGGWERLIQKENDRISKLRARQAAERRDARHRQRAREEAAKKKARQDKNRARRQTGFR